MSKESNIEKTCLPDGWEIKSLGHVCGFQNGFAFKSNTYKDDGVAVVRITNIQDESINLSKLVYIDPNDYDKSLSKYEITKGDLLIAMSGATTGKIGIHKTEEILLLNQRVGKFKPSDILNKAYLLNFLKTKVEESLAISAGAAQPNLSTEQIKSFQIPLPPLPQQKQIVAILDKAFAAIDTAKANAEQNLKNAKELFKSYLQNVFENKGDDWEDSILGKVCGFQNGFAFKSKDSVDSSNTQVVRMGNLYQNKLNLERKPAFYSDSLVIELGKYLLKENDLIISLTGTTGKEDYGYTVKIPEVERNLFLNQRIAKFIIKDEKALARDFLFRFLLSRVFLDELFKTAKGTRQANLSTEIMKSLPISYPTMKEQKLIIQKLDSLSAETKKLEAIYTQKIADLEEMKKSVLQKAFSGQLNTVT